MISNERNETYKSLETFIKGRYFLVSILTLSVLLVALCIFNISYLFQVFKNNFLLFYPVFYFVIEGIRTVIILWMVYLIVRLAMNSRKKGYLDSLYIEKIICLLAIGLISFGLIFLIFFFQVYLTHPFASILFMAIVIGSGVLLIVYLNQINALPINDKKPIPNPTMIVSVLLSLVAFLIIHFLYRTQGGNYSIFASRSYFFLTIPFAKYGLLMLIDLALVNLFVSLSVWSNYRANRNYGYAVLVISAVLLVVSLLTVITSKASNFVEDYYESSRVDDVMITTKDFLIYPAQTNYSSQTWSNHQLTFYDFSINSWRDLYDNKELIPSITAHDTVSIMLPETARIQSITVYDENDQIMNAITTWDALSELPEGTYAVKLVIRNTTTNQSTIIDYLFALTIE